MKKITKLAYAGAIALLSAGFYACSSSDEMENVNPTYDGKAVKTSFTISIGDVKGNATRMSETSVQKAETFQGMTDIYLFPSKAAITGDTYFSEDAINLSDFDNFDKYNDGSDATVTTSTNAKIYNDVKLSVGVSNFLFYAAIPTTSNKNDNGQLKPSYLAMDKSVFNGTADWPAETFFNASNQVSEIKFDLVPYQKKTSTTEATITDVNNDANAKNVLKLLNDIDAALTAQISKAKTASDDTTEGELTEKQNILRNFKDTDNDGVKDADETEFNAFAGSAISVLALAEDMYNFGKNLNNDYGTAVCTAITGAGPTAAGDATNGYTLSWTETFPQNLNLPDGAVAVKWDGSKFAFTDDYNIEGLTSPTISTYTHPARLYYTINTSSMVKNSTYLKNLGGTEAWTTVQGQYADGAITAATKSVIMKDQVQYAVGRLDVQVTVTNQTNLKDNGSGILNSSDKDPQLVSVPTNGYTITGVLVGGQKQVDWAFKPISTATEQTIWDSKITTATSAKLGVLSSPNHTLVLETAKDQPINIAVEFTNEGNDFYGFNHKLIPHGTKFYLVAQLDPKSTSATGYNESSLNSVFKQDYITTAKLTIGEESLKKAYNVIPDLRSPKLEFGLSVDLTWRAGITFEQEFNK